MTDDEQPGRRHRPDEYADELRRRLDEQAGRAPRGDFLAERIIARVEATQPGAGGRFGSRWGRLLAVAAAIAVVVGIGAVALVVTDTDSDRPDNQAVQSVTPPPTASAPATSPAPPTKTPSKSPEASGSPRKITVGKLTNVSIADITFTGGGKGWALATADCLKGTGTCSALLHTDDSGRSWESRPGTPFTVFPTGSKCAASDCVSHIRFATDDTGYAFSAMALFMTTDGAKHWTRLDGGADALETLDGNVIRISSDTKACPPGCVYTAQVADVGSTAWRSVTLIGQSGAAGAGVSLSRTGDSAYVLARGNPNGGSSRATSILWSSDDDGLSWTKRGEPCSQGTTEVDATDLTTAADGAAVVVCRQRGQGAQAVAVSTDGGKKFAQGPFSLGAADVLTLGAASSHVVLVSSDQTYRTIDGGTRFTRADGLGAVSYLGFSSGTDAHAIAADGRTIFTTDDAGRSWQAGVFR